MTIQFDNTNDGEVILKPPATGSSTITFPTGNGASGNVLITDGSGTLTWGGVVTSVSMTVPTGLTVTGSPITTTGTLAVTLTAGYSIPTTAKQTEWDTAYADRNKWDGGATGLVAGTGRTSLGATTVGSNLFTLTNPSAVTFLRVNADNTVSALTESSFRTAIGATTVGGNLFTLTNPSAVTFLRVNADNTISALSDSSFRTAIGAGTVTSVGGTGTVSGLTLTGTVTTSGNLTLGGTLAVTASNFASQTANTFLAAPNGAPGVPTFRAIVAADVPTLNQNTTGNAATVTVADAAADTSTWVLLGTSQTGNLSPATDAGLTYNASTNALTAATFIGALTGNASTVTTNANLTGHVTSVGNATTLGSFTVAQLNTALSDGDVATGGGTATGTNTGDQTITLTGNVTGSGTGSFATTIAAGVVTLAMQANVATATVFYRKTAGSGAPEVQTLATLKTDLGLTGTNSGDQTITLTGDVTGSGTGSFATTIAAGSVDIAMLSATGTPSATTFLRGDNTWSTPVATVADGDKGDITVSGTGATWTIDNGVVSLAKMADVATATVFYRKTAGTGAPEVQTLATLKTDLGLTGTNSGDQTITLTGNVTGSGTGSFATTIAAGVVTLAMQANVATSTVFYRKTAGSGAPEVQTLATLKTDLGLTGTNSGDQTITLTSDVTGSGTGSFATTIAANVVTYAKMQQASAGFTIMAKATTAAGNYAELAAGTDSVLMRSGSGNLTFSTIVANQITANAVTYAKIQQASAGYTILAKATTGAGNYAELAAGADTVLRRSGSGDLAFGTIVTNNIAASAVTLAKMADVATATVFYRKTAGTGAPEVQTLATLKTDLGLTGTNSGDQTITLTGDVTGSGTSSFATTIAAGAVDIAMLSATGTPSATTFLRGDNTWSTPVATVADGDKGDITVSGTGATWTIDNGVVSLAKMADVATATVFYRKTAGTGAPEVQTLATLKTDLGLTGTNSGDQTITLTGNVTGSGTGSFATTIAANVVTYAKMQQASAGFTIMAKATTAAGNYAELAAGVDTVLRRSGSGDLAFGTIVTNNIGALQVTYAKIQNVSATDRLLGRDTAAAGVIEELTATGGIEFTGTGIRTSAFTGDVTKTAGGTALTVDVTAITGKTEDTTPDASNDFVLSYDASATSLKKVKMINIPTSGAPYLKIIYNNENLAIADNIQVTGHNTISFTGTGELQITGTGSLGIL